MKLLMLCEVELPADIFLSAKATQRLEPHWLALLDEVKKAADEYGVKVGEVRCDHVRPRTDSRSSPEGNGAARRSRTPRTQSAAG